MLCRARRSAIRALISSGEVLVRQRHVRPHRVAAGRRALDAAQNTAHRRRLTPRRVGVPRVFVAVERAVGRFVDLHEAWVVRMTAGDGMVFELAEALGECDVIGARDVLISQEQDLVPQQCGLDPAEQLVVVGSVREADADQLGADGAGQGLDAHVGKLVESGTPAHCR